MEEKQESLDVMRGILLGLLIGLVMWTLIGGMIWFAFSLL